MTVEKLRKIVIFKQLLESGLNQTKASFAAGLDPRNTGSYIRKYRLKVPNKGRQYQAVDNYFDNIDTEKKAYLLGFFLADGYVIKEDTSCRVCLNNSIDDLEAVTLFRDEISPDSKIIGVNKQSGAKARKPQVIVRINSKPLYTTLVEKYGIVQNKTQNHEFEFDLQTIPDNLLRHFIRGYFDGDGSVSCYTTPGGIYFNFSFVFNSIKFCNQIGDIFSQLFKIRPVVYSNQGKTSKYHALRFDYSGRRGSIMPSIYDYLYKDSTVFLERKRIKFENYFKYLANSNNKNGWRQRRA